MSFSSSSNATSTRSERIAQLKRFNNREDLPIEMMIQTRSLLFELLTLPATQSPTELQHLDDVIDVGDSLLRILPATHDELSRYLDALGFLKASRFQMNGCLTDIGDAINLGRRAVNLIPDSDRARPNVANNLAFSLSARYKVANDLSDIDEAIEYTRQLVQMADSHDPRYLACLLNLGARLQLRFHKTGDIENSHEALTTTRRICQTAKPDSSEYGAALLNLGLFSIERFDKTGFWKDIEEAIRLQRLGLGNISPSHESWFQCCGNLAKLFSKKYEKTKMISDIEEAIRYGREAVLALPICDSMHSARSQYLTSYLGMLVKFSRATSNISDVVRAVSDAADLIHPMPETYADLVLNLYSYGELLSRQYELSSKPMDLQLLVDGALSFASQSNQSTNPEGRSTTFDTTALLRIFYHSTKLVTEPQNHSIVIQITRSMHQEYLRLVNRIPFADALIALENEVVINAEIVIIKTRDMSSEDLEKEIDEKANYAISLGAKSYQPRIKLVDITLQFGSASTSTDPIQRLSASLAGCNLSQNGNLVTEKRCSHFS